MLPYSTTSIDTGDADVCLLLSRDAEFFKELGMATAFDSDEKPPTYDCTIEATTSDKQARNDVSAVNNVCSSSDVAKKWHDIFLNHAPTLKPTTDPTDASGLSTEQRDVLLTKAPGDMRFRPEKEGAIRGIRSLHGLTMLVNGPPGCGKTLFAADIIIYTFLLVKGIILPRLDSLAAPPTTTQSQPSTT